LGVGIGAIVLIQKAFGDGPAVAAMFIMLLGLLALQFVAQQKVILVHNDRLRRELAAALQRRTGQNLDDGQACFVGWAPGAVVSPKDLETDHDVGFLHLTPDALVFEGDTVRFELPRRQIYAVRPGMQGVPILMPLGYRITIEWVDDYGHGNAFTLERREGRSRRQVQRGTKALADAILAWLHGPQQPSPV
jgi:hypothetical protein